ncbi:hypothetical protein [Mucilaginibacter sp. CSA2-8R]|uniref:hypothetical protein n=1 Tax=Mucilaginibacter sp. CSA2-8R TaxID=3141542 RepID=UPI00315DD4DC
MITTEKLNIYQRFNGDSHEWGQFGSEADKAAMDDDDWMIIDGLVQDICLVNTGLAADALIKSVDEKLDEYCADEYAIHALKSLALGKPAK